VSYDTILKWIGDGELAATRVGRQFRIKQADLDRRIGEGGGVPFGALIAT
jgi:hypothetical protein